MFDCQELMKGEKGFKEHKNLQNVERLHMAEAQNVTGDEADRLVEGPGHREPASQVKELGFGWRGQQGPTGSF